MIALWKWYLRRWAGKIWVPIAAYGLAAVATALAASVLPPVIDVGKGLIAANSITTILQIMASSLLAVTTFSVSIMVSAFSGAASGATPRATPLLRDDKVTQGVLATFIGGFIYSLVSIIGLETGIYGPAGRFLLFVVTLLVLAAIVWQLVRWIGHLADYGRLPDIAGRVEAAATSALEHRMQHPFLGGRPLDSGARTLAAQGVALAALKTCYVQNIDMQALGRAAEKAQVTLALMVLPGSFAHPGADLIRIMPPGRPDDDLVKAIHAAFVVDRTRSFDQDPRFGILTLTEIAQRALSPAVNDPGTAIDILGRHMRVLSSWVERADPDLTHPRILVPGLALTDMMDDAFDAIARDGAGLIEVQVRLFKALAGLARQAPAVFATDAARLARRALTQAEAALPLDEDKDRLRSLAGEIEALCAVAPAPELRKA